MEEPNDYKLQTKMLFLLDYNLKMVTEWGRVEFTFGGGGGWGDKNLVRGDEQILAGVGDSLHPPSKENPGMDIYH